MQHRTIRSSLVDIIYLSVFTDNTDKELESVLSEITC